MAEQPESSPDQETSSSEEVESNNTSTEQATSSEETESELSAALAKAEANWELYLRSQAEIENLRRRAQKDLENAHKFAMEKFASELLGVKDSLELGLSVEDADAEKLREGTELTLKMLTQVMEKFNIKTVDPLGENFDPNLHQAMTMQETNEHAPNTVIAVMQKGYLLNDRLMRPAMVVVAKQAE
jgi:molecular chaperone GrpE